MRQGESLDVAELVELGEGTEQIGVRDEVRASPVGLGGRVPGELVPDCG